MRQASTPLTEFARAASKGERFDRWPLGTLKNQGDGVRKRLNNEDLESWRGF